MQTALDLNLFESEGARSLLDQLLDDARLYRKGKDFRALLDFVVRLRNFAPFNAMLLQVQKPGLLYAASRRDWRERFARTVKPSARPLLILWPFGPVALVYDVVDTEGDPMPKGVSPFAAHGVATQEALDRFAKLLSAKGIEWNEVDAGDGRAGSIETVRKASEPRLRSTYRLNVNRNHNVNVQFATLAHELAHLYLGHLRADKYLGVPDRRHLGPTQQELEAESVAFLVCARNEITSESETYLSQFVGEDTSIEDLDVYHVMRAAGQIETLLGLSSHTKFDQASERNSRGLATSLGSPLAKPAGVPAPAGSKSDDLIEREKAAKAQMFAAAADLAHLLGKNIRASITPE